LCNYGHAPYADRPMDMETLTARKISFCCLQRQSRRYLPCRVVSQPKLFATWVRSAGDYIYCPSLIQRVCEYAICEYKSEQHIAALTLFLILLNI